MITENMISFIHRENMIAFTCSQTQQNPQRTQRKNSAYEEQKLSYGSLSVFLSLRVSLSLHTATHKITHTHTYMRMHAYMQAYTHAQMQLNIN